MLKAKTFLAVDCGASTLKLAEFEINEAGGLRLCRYTFKPLGLQGSQEATREAVMVAALKEALAEGKYAAKSINVCAPGFHVFSKFVKLPPVDAAKVTQIIQYEAQQNVPFPLEEVVWDYQILGTGAGGELEVLLVAIKTDVVEGLFRSCESAGLKVGLVDVSPAALCNAFRFNYGDLEGCTMLLDIGAKTSNLLFFEKGKVYSRSINIGANSITQDFANECRIPFEDAEKIKIEKGFVSLGGAYEEPDDVQAAAISKIARQVMTRLHIQVNQTIQHYRSQQGGSAPQRLFLSGGASIMPFAAQFFAEKLNVPVEYFNPLRNIDRAPDLNLEELAKVAHCLGEVVGLGLRNLAHCPVELNLMPQSSVRRQEFGQKKPYILATVACLVAGVFAYAYLWQKQVEIRRRALDDLKAQLQPLAVAKGKLTESIKTVDAAMADADVARTWIAARPRWAEILPALRESLMATEAATKTSMNQDAGIWIEQLSPMTSGELPGAGEPAAAAVPAANNRGRGGGGGEPQPQAPVANQVTHLLIKVRALDMKAIKPEANTTMAFELLKQLKSHTAVFDTSDPNPTAFRGEVVENPQTKSFTTEILLKLKHPINF